MHMQEALVRRSNPQATITIQMKESGPEIPPTMGLRIRFDFSANELPDSAGCGDHNCALGVFGQSEH
jgi:hypothetical protein